MEGRPDDRPLTDQDRLFVERRQDLHAGADASDAGGADEEGARFGRSLLGSSAFAGTHSIAADRGRMDRDGVHLEDALRRCGVEIGRFPEAEQERANAAAYIELHIEQGPVLESLGLPLGVVLGTKGVERHAITFHGQEAHSGSTPMHARRDALAAAAKLALEIRAIAGKQT